MKTQDVFIVAAKRTPVGGILGQQQHLSATQMGSTAIEAAMRQAGIKPHLIDSVYMGHVLTANAGQSPARQAARNVGITDAADATTVNKVCASGIKSIVLGAQQIQLGIDNLVVTGGMESMSNTPHYIKHRGAAKLGNGTLVDGVLRDGLTDAYHGHHMGVAAELCATKYNLTREAQDVYAISSYEKAVEATKTGKFNAEIVPVPSNGKGGAYDIFSDEDIYKLKPEKVNQLTPAFQKGGTITAANASNLNDGAAAIILASASAVKEHNLKPMAVIRGYADAAQEPDWFTTSPSLAIVKAMKLAGLKQHEIDYWEINEAYAAVVLANRKILNLPIDRINVYGGAVAMGHPIGASGARIAVTLLSVLNQEGGKYGVAAICNGGGGATALIIEKL